MPDTERFQSTPSLRRATAIIIEGPLRLQVSIHALLAESDLTDPVSEFIRSVSIHALLAESDPERPKVLTAEASFQSTPSLRRATAKRVRFMPAIHVSIHALLAESDPASPASPGPKKRFNPRPPCGERLNTTSGWRRSNQFQSTPSLRRATSSSHKQR